MLFQRSFSHNKTGILNSSIMPLLVITSLLHKHNLVVFVITTLTLLPSAYSFCVHYSTHPIFSLLGRANRPLTRKAVFAVVSINMAWIILLFGELTQALCAFGIQLSVIRKLPFEIVRNFSENLPPSTFLFYYKFFNTALRGATGAHAFY